MTLFSDAMTRGVAELASRAPSVHNIQPARWRFRDDRVTLFRAIDRKLPAADPSGHDVNASLGAAFEGMCLALSEWNSGLQDLESMPDENAAGCESVVRATIRPGYAEDRLARHVRERRSFRGKFSAIRPGDFELIRRIGADDASVVEDRGSIRGIATGHEAATWKFESNAEYHEELWSWLRLSRDDSSWNRDGLNADCLALSDLERGAAQILLAPAMFKRLSRLGLAKKLISEAPQVNSASALVVFAPLRNLSAFDTGRRLYRLWLELTALGFCAVPMSASADDAETNAWIADLVSLQGERRIANVLRVGRAEAVAVSPRLPLGELMV